jgi:phi13 family phage major tail protein
MAVTSGVIRSPLVGINNFHLAELLTDTKEGATYGEIISFPWLRSVNMEATKSEGELYADNHTVDTNQTTTKYDLTVETATLPLEYRGWLLGHKFENGVLVEKADDAAPYFCVKFDMTKSNGKKIYVTLFKVQFSEPSENPKTKEENTEYNTPTMNAKAIFREAGGIRAFADEEEPDYLPVTGDSWYTDIEPVTSTTP